MNNFKIFDISPYISSSTAVFPGDTQFKRNELMSTQNGDHLSLSFIKTTLHIGAHTDAPNHYHKNGLDIASRDINYYLGECQVIEVKLNKKERITSRHIENIKVTAPRVLFKTNSYTNPDQWTSDFNSLSAELVDYLAKKNVKLIGIDTPSVDPSDDKNLESHLAIYQHDMAILEGITLREVKPDLYKLIAIPLKIKGADASPVRAILIQGTL
jgi:arylformamidase